jgi:hypothetical protein
MRDRAEYLLDDERSWRANNPASYDGCLVSATVSQPP